VSVDMDVVGVMAAYCNPLSVCACVCVCVFHSLDSTHTHTHTQTHTCTSGYTIEPFL